MENQPAPDLPPQVIAKVIEELKTKSKENLKLANTYFYMVIGVITGGLFVFIFAYRFTSSFEIQNVLQGSKDYLDAAMVKQRAAIDSVNKNLITLDAILTSKEVLGIDTSEFDYDSTSGRVNISLTRMSPSEYAQFFLIRRYLKRLPEQRPGLAYVLDSNDSIAASYYDTFRGNIIQGMQNFELYNLINTTAIRFGSVLIVLFLVQILVRVFRYNTRLANFYTARAQALELYAKDPNLKFETLVATLSPDALDIGMSKNPSEQLLELAKLFSKNS